MTSITATEFKRNFGKYLILAQSEGFEVTKNGKPIINVTPVDAPADAVQDFEPVSSISELFGILHGDIDLEQARWERLKEKCGL